MKKVFAWFCTNSGELEKDLEFKSLLSQMEKANIIIAKENGKNAPWDSEPTGYSFTGTEEVIRKILILWFPDYSEDIEWAEVEKVDVE